MRLGIVGHAAEKFTPETEDLAKTAIIKAISRHGATCVVSGRSPMGGVDVWAEQIAQAYGIDTDIYPPTHNSWGAVGGFKDRNLKIARNSDLVLCIVVKELPPDFKGMRFNGGCYHCKKSNPEHVKSGGCWTAWRARAREWVII